MTDADGDAASFRFGLDQIRVGDGNLLDIGGPGTVTVVAGPNNVGKSTFLNQIREILMSTQLTRSQEPRVVTEIGSPWGGAESDMAAWLRATSVVKPSPVGEDVFRFGLQTSPMHGLVAQLQHPTPGALVNWFVSIQTASNRLSGAEDADRMHAPGEPPQNALQVLHVDREKLAALTDVLKRLFGLDLFLERTGLRLSLRIGSPVSAPYPVDTFDEAYDSEVAALPYIKSQGDGIRSAVGLLLPLLTGPYPLVLLDEPEAYLHPPQARIIGREIGKLTKTTGNQVIIATHDRSVLQGVLESGTPTTVLHLTREGNTAIADTLSPSKVAELWQDPSLRYTNALEGLFHSAVVVAEGERDAHFYNAAIDHIMSTRTPEPPEHNLMFLGSNGKTNMARIAEGLRTLGVRVVSCPDLDILNNEKVLQRLVIAHGGDWAELAADYLQATNHL